MADDQDNKTERATPRRRQEARESGQVSKSADLTAAILLLVALMTLNFTGESMVSLLKSVLEWMLGSNVSIDARQMFENDLRVTGPAVVKAVAPIFASVIFAALMVVGLQVGFHVSFAPLVPNLAKLNPFQGFGRLFAGRNAMQMVMNLAKATAIGITAWNFIHGEMATLLALSGMPFPANFEATAGIVWSLAWRLGWTLLIIAVADWLYQKWRFERDIRMSKQEIKEESKRMEGDQEIKGRRRQLARKMIIQRIHRDVPKADVVITNPTELAIALRYDTDGMSAPKVVAKGSGFLAARIRQIAIQNGVPILERKPLAQAIYKTVEVGQEVPPQFYQAIAEILAYVYELAGKGKRMLATR